MNPPKHERLQECFRRMESAPGASSFDEAYALLCSTINQVEDELTDIPNNPSNWKTDGRLYPPQTDRMSTVQPSDVKRFDSRRHVTYIAPSGAFEIRTRQLVDGKLVVHFSKAGGDGKSVVDICPQLADRNL